MRGSDQQAGALFSYVDLDRRVRADHSLRVIQKIVNEVLADLSAGFEAMCAPGLGRPSIPPERLDHDLLFRWFVGMGIDDPARDQTTFSKNRDRLLAGNVAHRFLTAVMAHPRVKRLLSSDHFSVDGTMIEAWASMNSFKPKDGSGDPPAPGRNGEADFHGQSRSNDTHQSTTDPGARLLRKGRGNEAKLCFLGHALMENRHGLIVDACLTAHDRSPRRPARSRHRCGADKGYDTEDFINELRLSSRSAGW
jgi:transposase